MRPGSLMLAGPGLENSAAMGPRLLCGVITVCCRREDTILSSAMDTYITSSRLQCVNALFMTKLGKDLPKPLPLFNCTEVLISFLSWVELSWVCSIKYWVCADGESGSNWVKPRSRRLEWLWCGVARSRRCCVLYHGEMEPALPTHHHHTLSGPGTVMEI